MDFLDYRLVFCPEAVIKSWSGVDYCDVFISCSLILTAPIHCIGVIGEQVMEYQICSEESN